ncbi:MAG TPA: methyltransferase domain-containing protein [Vicinamibacterales bacterium]|nr:methyltransferase domain-containing protein [Vicinamibacterales bacterium]
MDVIVSNALLDTQRAFDGVAAFYDRSNAENAVLRAMRARVWAAVDTHVSGASHLLDLGCGPGCDADRFAAQGHRVTAIDWSPAMVSEARRRVHANGHAERVEVHHLGIHDLDRLAPVSLEFDAAYSNFGPLNCVAQPNAAAHMIADRIRPGGILVASVIGRVCPWEIAVHAARGQFARARIRFTRGLAPVPLDGRTVWTRYYTPGEFQRIFEIAGFTRVALRALGLFVPPPYMDAFCSRHPALVSALQRIDDGLGACPGIRAWGDHFLIVMRKA